jgi:hypothetical protein
MSQWRRVAMEEVPHYKRVVETSPSPGTMWSRLYDEIPFELPDDSDEDAALGRLFDFAVACQKNKFGHHLNREAWLFFHLVAGAFFYGNEPVRKHLPPRLAWKEFEQWARAIGKSDEELRLIKSEYYR